jgi:hypothetical protein
MGYPSGSQLHTKRLEHAGELQGMFESSARSSDTRIFSFLIDQPTTSITPSLMLAALGNTTCGRDITKIILDRRRVGTSVSEIILEKAAKSGNIEFFQWYLERHGGAFSLSERVIRGMTESRDRGLGIISIVLRHSGGRAMITEQHLKIASKYSNSELVALLIGHQEIETLITGDVVQQAIANYNEGPKIFQLF